MIVSRSVIGTVFFARLLGWLMMLGLQYEVAGIGLWRAVARVQTSSESWNEQRSCVQYGWLQPVLCLHYWVLLLGSG